MSRSSSLGRWVPAIAIPALIVTGALVVPLQASASSDLPDQTPRQLLEFAASANVPALSGTIDQTSNLGLPDLSALGSVAGGAGGSGSSGSGGTGLSSVIDLATGSHTARVFLDGGNARVQVMDHLAERDVIRTADSAWFYSSGDQTAVHVALPAHDGTGDTARTAPDGTWTPQVLAEKFLSEADVSTSVTVGEDTTVAGRSAYTLVLTPKDTATLIDSVTIAIDSETGLPLSVAVDAGADSPALEVAFSQLTIGAPDAALFDFTPPAGTTVTEQALPTKAEIQAKKDGSQKDGSQKDGATRNGAEASGKSAASAAEQPTVIGTGWATIVSVPASAVPAEMLTSPLLDTLTQPVDGGRVFSTAVANVLLTTDGRVFAGSVPVDALLAAAAGR